VDLSSIGRLIVAQSSRSSRRFRILTAYRKLNKSPTTVEDPSFLKLPLCDPKVKKITLHFPLGLEVTARNLKGVTIKDALDAIHKQFKKRVRFHLAAFHLPSLRTPLTPHSKTTSSTSPT
jgi:hypothetical protein